VRRGSCESGYSPVRFGTCANATGNRIGIDFESAWRRRTRVVLESRPENIQFTYIGLGDLIQNKRASARPKAREDLPFLIEALK